MLDDLGETILIIITVTLLALTILFWMALNFLAYKYRHENRLATGHFKVTLSKQDWDAGVKTEAFAIAVKDQTTGAVMMTVQVEKEQVK